MTEKQQARFGSHPVYCQTAAGICCKEKIFLGYHPTNVAVRCDICGRWSRCEPGKGGATDGQGEDARTSTGSLQEV